MPRKTNVYIAGLNLFYGALKGTPYKWLDQNRLYAFLPDINNGLKAESVSDRAHSALRSKYVLEMHHKPEPLRPPKVKWTGVAA